MGKENKKNTKNDQNKKETPSQELEIREISALDKPENIPVPPRE